MAIRSNRACADPHVEINVTPLIDVMLALVVVFMIAAPLVMKRIALPIGSDPGAIAASAEPVRLGVGADGTLTWNDRAIMPQLVREQLRMLAERQPQPELRIEVAPNANYQSFASVLADAKIANVARISVLDRAPR
jgi:biopolymer transport protein ExbD